VEENTLTNKEVNPNINSQKQIASAIIVAGLIIAGAILLKDGGAPVASKPISKMIGLNTKSFDACLASGKFKDKIEASINDGLKAGVTGTPFSFIVKNGKVIDMINGAQPFNKVTEQIANARKQDRNPMSVEMRPVNTDDHILGNKDAQIIIVEYSDFECPFCKVFHKTMHEVVEKNSDIAWVYRHYPIVQLHPNASREAEASECAWEQKGNDGFWKYADKLFEITPSNNGLLESQL
jgi:protein-disulfide isomerase